MTSYGFCISGLAEDSLSIDRCVQFTETASCIRGTAPNLEVNEQLEPGV